MFSSDQNIETISKMLNRAKDYGNMRLETFERSLVDKLSTIISGLIIGIVFMFVGLIVIVCVTAAVVIGIAPHTGGYLPALLIATACYALLAVIIYTNRRTLLILPLKRSLAQVIFEERAEQPAPTSEEINQAKQDVIDEYEALIAPPSPARNRWEQAMQTATRAWSVADGIIMGYKLYKRFKPFLRHKRRK